jgi:hypothetical protein
MENKKQIELVPTKIPFFYNVQLNLDHQTRHIGKLDMAGEGTFLTNRKPEHLFKKLQAIGINHSLLVDEKIPFRWIVIDYQGRKLVTSRLYFLTHSKCFKFGNQGFELQCFLSVKDFDLSRAREFESKQVIQENLFAEVI